MSDDWKARDSSPVVDWSMLYNQSDLEACRGRFGRDLRYEWIGLGRGLAQALGRPDVFDGLREDVPASRLPPATVFILGRVDRAIEGAIPGDGDRASDGCLGHVSATVGSPGGVVVEESRDRILGGDALAASIAGAVVATVRPLMPDIASPNLEVITPRPGEGDSHGLAIGLAVLHALLGARVSPGTAASGGFDPERSRFTPVAPDSLPSKAAAASRWGVRRILVVEGQEVPAELRDGRLEWVEVSSDPSALVLELLRNPDEATGEAEREVLRQALAMYDIRVARAFDEPSSRVFEVTEPFLVDADRDPVLGMLAADIRSRSLLHAGRSIEAEEWNRRAARLVGRGDLPPGLLGDHLLYQRPSHESVLAIDLGVFEDDAPTHRALDQAIDDLGRRWCTRHQVLLHLFARNTRWRRRLYLARRREDPDLLAAAEEDLRFFADRWSELLDDHATRDLGMGNSDLARQWNYVLEHHATRALLLGGRGDDPLDQAPVESATEQVRRDGPLVAEIRRRETRVEALSPFDLRGLIQGWWLLREATDSAVRAVEGRLASPGDAADVIWVEWYRRQSGTTSPGITAALERAVRPHLAGVGATPAGIGRLIALRRAAMLDLDGRPGPESDGEGWVASLAVPERPASLVEAFEDLRSDPGGLLLRTPY